MINYKSKPAFQYGNEVSDICKPLFLNTPIDFMEFIRSYADGSYLTFCNSLEWLEHYFEREYYKKTCFHGKPNCYKRTSLMTDCLSYSSEITRDASNYFHIHDSIAIVIPGEKYTDTFVFGSKSKKNIHSFYLNNMDLLERFTFYFYDKSTMLINKHECNKFKFLHQEPKILEREFKDCFRKEGTKRGLDIDNYYLHGALDCKISGREAECIKWMAAGKTSEEIGIILNVSKRTVESHMNRIKKKLHCYKLSQIVVTASELNII